MFSWSSGKHYPGTRPSQRPNTNTTTTTTTTTVAQTVQGSIRPPEYTRAQHLESYLSDNVLKRSTRKVSRDDTTYDTVFQTTSGATLIVRVHLPTAPTNGVKCRAPGMTLAGIRAKHPWIDSRMRVTGYAPIQSDGNWKARGILLGPAVHEVVKHLQLNAPKIIEITDPGLRSIQPNGRVTNGSTSGSTSSSAAAGSSHRQNQGAGSNSHGNGNSVGGKNNNINGDSNNHNHHHHNANDDAPPPDYEASFLSSSCDNDDAKDDIDINSAAALGINLPQIPSNFDAQLNSLSREELESLLEDEIQFTTFVNRLPVMEKILEARCSLLEENVNQAQLNLAEESELRALRDDVNELRKEFVLKAKEFQTLEHVQDSICAPPNRRTVIKQLAKTKKDALESSETLAEEWLDQDDADDDETNNKNNDADQFVKRFVQERMKHHERAAKIELLQSLR